MKKFTPLIISIAALIYYVVLSAKQWTWIFVSSDSGDWLICANQWFLPQPYGSPLYILPARLIGLFTDGNSTVAVMTVLLSCLPAAITVMLVYLIVRRLTNKLWIAFASSLVLLGCGVFLTQSIVLEQYTSVIMFCTLAYWFYINDKRKLTALCLGLSVAVHMFALSFAVFWFILEHRRLIGRLMRIPLQHRWTVLFPVWAIIYRFARVRRLWLAPLAIFVAVGVTSYSLIPILMHLDGNLTLVNLWAYWTGETGAVLGTLSVFDTPARLQSMMGVIVMSLGLALIPLWFGLKKPYDTKKGVLLMMVVVSLWYHLTSLDPASWTFLNFGIPAMIVLVSVGLDKLTLKHTQVIIVGALVLICINGVFLNANTLTQERPVAATYYNELTNLPDGSIIAATGAYAFGILYVASEEDRNFTILSTEEQVRRALDRGEDVYFAGPPNKVPAFMLTLGNEMIHKITGMYEDVHD